MMKQINRYWIAIFLLVFFSSCDKNKIASYDLNIILFEPLSEPNGKYPKDIMELVGPIKLDDGKFIACNQEVNFFTSKNIEQPLKVFNTNVSGEKGNVESFNYHKNTISKVFEDSILPLSFSDKNNFSNRSEIKNLQESLSKPNYLTFTFKSKDKGTGGIENGEDIEELKSKIKNSLKAKLGLGNLSIYILYKPSTKGEGSSAFEIPNEMIGQAKELESVFANIGNPKVPYEERKRMEFQKVLLLMESPESVVEILSSNEEVIGRSYTINEFMDYIATTHRKVEIKGCDPRQGKFSKLYVYVD